MEDRTLDAVCETILILCRGYGFDILRYPDNVRSYVAKKVRGAEEALNLCEAVLRVPAFTDCLMWCRYYADDPERLEACRESFRQILRQRYGDDGRDLGAVFDRLVQAGLKDIDTQGG